ncbi:MAG: alpha/beta fold hydrolase [Kordiimonadaceae bacterium]|nr:alpha/beta fold hydrolase [Kordiimonadaceae bacterium]MBO6567695.1 alpha/beta fold hydrolase [Kordiimonadaceae bacterium]MBO6963091.1 alpha/beta fold hydrolase [Kordiimonadaceae bacterium]
MTKPIVVPAVRTDDSRFSELNGWAFEPRYTDTLPSSRGLRLHYIDEGPRPARRTILCLHGQKTWSYAFRKAVPIMIGQGFRVVAMDYYGFGRSDKPIGDDFYDFGAHRKSVLELIDELQLENVIIAGFDWGGWIGSTIPMDRPGAIKGLLLGNFMHHLPEETIWAGFEVWRASHNAQDDPEVSETLASFEDKLSPDELRGFDAPFPDKVHKAGVRAFPNMVPLEDTVSTAHITRQAIDFLSHEWNGVCQLVAGTQDPVLGLPSLGVAQTRIRGALPIIKLTQSGPLVFEHSNDFLKKALAAF